MMLTTITVARLVNTGNYENFRLEATGELEDGEDLAAAFTWLQDRLDEACDERLARLHPWELRTRQRDEAAARTAWLRVQAQEAADQRELDAFSLEPESP